MADRRVKERERVWGRRPVILRFDPGHTRPVEPKQSDALAAEDASAMLAALFQSVIEQNETEMEPESAEAATAVAEPPPKPKNRSFWRLQGPHMSFHIFPPRQS